MTTEQIIICIAIAAVIVILGIIIFAISRKRNSSSKKTTTPKLNVVKEEQKVEPIIQTPNIEEQPIEEEQEDDDETSYEEEPVEQTIQVVNGRQIFVQYNYSFKAKLILASKEVQEQYKKLMHYVKCYGVKTSLSWKQERIYLGRNTYAMLVFKGKKLCVAYALDPKDFLETKYKIIDLSEIKRFAKVPTLIKLSSERKQKYSLELFDMLFEKEGLSFNEVESEDIFIPTQSKDELIEDKLIKVYTSEEVSEGDTLRQANVEDIIRKNITIQEAKTLISDDSVLEYVEVVEGSAKKAYTKKDIINIDTLSKAFLPNDYVNLETLKQKKLISDKVDFIKVLARGTLDKPLIIEAQDFSIDAVKMIILTGGEARKTN